MEINKFRGDVTSENVRNLVSSLFLNSSVYYNFQQENGNARKRKPNGVNETSMKKMPKVNIVHNLKPAVRIFNFLIL